MSKKKKAIIAVSAILSSIILIIAVFSVREKILRRAEWTQGIFEFDGRTNEEIDYREIGSYEENLESRLQNNRWSLDDI